MLQFRETSLFTRQITTLLSDDEYGELQSALSMHPDAGAVIPGTSGLRKVRWGHGRRGKGKRGGVRVIYYWYTAEGVIYMLLAYSKDESDDLTAAQKRTLTQLIREEIG